MKADKAQMKLFSIFITSITNGIIINTDNGLIKGQLVQDDYATFYSYRGIPYAEPPIGKLRFMPPLPKEPWLGSVLDATEFGAICPQEETKVISKDQMSEDCLNLNVYVPVVNDSTPLAVLVFAHAGKFNSGSGRDNVNAPQFYMNHGVIMVTFNYRLGAIGFLSIQSEEASGNAGLKDSLLALKWVKNNIARFGGDPNNITFGGESAGSVIANYLLLSQRSTGLFQKAIMMSGSALGYRFLNKHPVQTAFLLGKRLRYQTNNTDELLQCLRKADPFDIVAAQNDKDNIRNGFSPYAPFVPVVEPELVEAFITRDPQEIIKSGIPQKLPTLIGFSSEEGIIMTPEISANFTLAEILNNNFELCIPSNIEYPYGSSESEALARSIKEFYFDGEDISIQTLYGYINLLTDTQYSYGIDSWIKSAELGNSLFYYVWNFDGDLNWTKIRKNIKLKGAAHLDHSGYMYPTSVTKPLLKTAGPKSKRMINIFLNLWTNFIKYGTPSSLSSSNNVTWLESGTERHYLLLNDQPIMVYEPPLKQRLGFWYKVYDQYDRYVKKGGRLEAKIIP